jgi:hypothetical protein
MERMKRMCKSRWLIPALAVVFGAGALAAEWIGGDPGGGWVSFAIMVGFGALVLLGGRSETIRGLRGDGRDERFAQMDLRATAAAGGVVIAAIIIAFLVEVSRGHSGAPYTWLGAIAGLSYLIAVIILRVRG